MKKSGKHDDSSGSRVNQLGGRYRNGKPLSPEMRRKVIELSLSGVRPCEISRQLKITHGCISKLLSKFFKTGSLVPGHGTAGRPRVITPWIEKHIDRYRKEQPGIFSWEIRERLLRENVCFETSLPSLSSINRLVKSKIKEQSSREPVQDNNEDEQKDCKNNVSKLNFKHTIDSILSCSDSNRTPNNHSSYQPVRKSNSYESQRTEEECSNDSTEDHFSDWKVVWTQNKSGENDSTFFSPTRGSLPTSQRIRFTRYQMRSLEKEFELNPYPSHAERETISKALDVEETKVWFSNRRAKVKRRASPSPIHSLHYPSTTNKPHHPCSCACNHLNTEPSFFPLHLNAGPSRLFFPPGYRSLNSFS